MKKRLFAGLIALVMIVGLLPVFAMADVGGSVYVNATTGSDTDGDGTESKPYKTLAKAVEKAPDGAVIYVMSDLTMTECARFYNKNLTITSYGNNTYTITRGGGFSRQQDDARSTYNPAMIEVQGENSCGLTLKNIILDDAGIKEGNVFAQAISGEGKDNNTVYVQDAVIASNATNDGTIILDEGAIIRNFGGMSAVRVTDKAKLVMKNGSKIEDTTVTDRAKGVSGSVGPAGAVWIQGAEFTMESGAEISNVIGRAVYADGGKVTINGSINSIRADGDMWQGINGVVLHLRNKATGELDPGCEVKKSNGTLFYVNNSELDMKEGSGVVDNLPGGNVIFSTYSTVTINNEIANNNTGNNHVLQTDSETVTTIGSSANIHDNLVFYGAIYLNGKNEKLDIYGKVNNNYSSDRGGGVVLSNNGGKKTAVMYSGAEICGNISKATGGGLMVSVGSFTMNGGKISDNIAGGEGGGVYVRRGGQFIMNSGEISNNATAGFGGGIAYSANNYSGLTPYVDLKGGTISGNKENVTAAWDGLNSTSADGNSNDLAISDNDYGYVERYFKVENAVDISDTDIRMMRDNKTIKLSDDSLNTKLGNASPDSNNALKAGSAAKGWASPLATFWAQRDGAASMEIGGLKLNDELPVYVLTQKTDENGLPAKGAFINVYRASVSDGKVSLMLPAADVGGNGCAVAIVQPTKDFGTLTIVGPEKINENKDTSDYEVQYTVTYAASDSMKNIIADSSATYTLTLSPDVKLTGTVDTSEFNGESITVKYTLPNGNFKVEDYLLTSAVLTIEVNQYSYTIPSNLAKTELVGLESYTVRFDLNGGSGEAAPVTVVMGETVGDSMPSDPSRTGYKFIGWNTKKDGSGIVFDKNTVVTGDITVYAQWSHRNDTVTLYTLHYESNGGTSYSDELYAYGATVKLDKEPTREGYDFTGWYSDKALTKEIASVRITKDTTVYAGWRKAEANPNTGAYVLSAAVIGALAGARF